MLRLRYVFSVSDAILVTVGRVYSCTMLFTLNNRGKIRGDTWIQTSDPPHDLDRCKQCPSSSDPPILTYHSVASDLRPT
jgi:hypothetical protein